MAKRIYTFWELLLGSLIALIGFGSCKTAKTVQSLDETPKLYGPPPTVIGTPQPIDRVVALYGVPPARLKETTK